ncbi:hypothetical protein PoB_001417500 [Plakobranchus ocellatus]|uniref:Uncharacterized protein n=1 Tax=Plakobranchus ocellatus TaxID=259542 RepID=A0AAV3YZ10_9GAST|nr:hypothetical protein PoB_001417500 [Plakobranchus ocellatus]
MSSFLLRVTGGERRRRRRRRRRQGEGMELDDQQGDDTQRRSAGRPSPAVIGMLPASTKRGRTAGVPAGPLFLPVHSFVPSIVPVVLRFSSWPFVCFCFVGLDFVNPLLTLRSAMASARWDITRC